MNPKAFVVALVFVAASVVSVPFPVLAQERQMLTPEGAQVIKPAPIFVLPDADRKPLRIAAKGSRLTVLAVAGEWYEVEWQDPQWGRRVGYVRVEFVRLDSQAALRDVPVPATPPTTPTPTPPQPTPAKPEAPAKPTTPQGPSLKKPASAAGRWTDRGYVNVNGVYQGGSRTFSEAFSLEQYAEDENVTAQYPKMDGPAFDVGGAFRIWRNLGAGVAVSRFTKTGAAAVDATIPHPLYLSHDRAIAGSFSPSTRTELAVHGQVACLIRGGRRWLITLAGGPSYFSVKQTLVSAVHWSESYPYDTALFTVADSQTISESALGFNGGVDVGFFFSRNIGIGAIVRYARAQIPLGSTSGQLKVDAGGFQAGGGLRIRFP